MASRFRSVGDPTLSSNYLYYGVPKPCPYLEERAAPPAAASIAT